MNRLRRRKLQPWPKSHESIAMRIDTRTKAMSGSLAWVPKGPALETYETKIRADLEATLANIELPEGAPLFLKLYMIGRDETSANPVVMVCCVNRGIRKEAESSIRESRVLDGFPGYGLGSSALLLESHGLEELLIGVCAPTDDRHAILTDLQGHQPENSQSQSDAKLKVSEDTLEIYGSFPHRLGGIIKFVSKSHGQVPVDRYATGGPIFQLGTELYQITAAHGMHSDTTDANIHYSTSELDECEFDDQFDHNDDITTSIGSVTPEECSTQSSDEDSHSSRLSGEDLPAPRADEKVPVVSGQHTRTQPGGIILQPNVEGGRYMGPCERLTVHFQNPNLDYVILKLPALPGMNTPISIAKPPQKGSRDVKKTSHVGPNSAQVLVVTLDGSIRGTIFPETTSYKMYGFTELQQLLTVELDEPFLKGYSGSAVVDSITGDVYGQIIVGNPGQSLAYCLRAPDIFEDILRKNEHVPILDERQWHINKQYDIRATSLPLRTGNLGMDLSHFTERRHYEKRGSPIFDPPSGLQRYYGMLAEPRYPSSVPNEDGDSTSNVVVRGSGNRERDRDRDRDDRNAR